MKTPEETPEETPEKKILNKEHVLEALKQINMDYLTLFS